MAIKPVSTAAARLAQQQNERRVERLREREAAAIAERNRAYEEGARRAELQRRSREQRVSTSNLDEDGYYITLPESLNTDQEGHLIRMPKIVCTACPAVVEQIRRINDDRSYSTSTMIWIKCHDAHMMVRVDHHQLLQVARQGGRFTLDGEAAGKLGLSPVSWTEIDENVLKQRERIRSSAIRAGAMQEFLMAAGHWDDTSIPSLEPAGDAIREGRIDDALRICYSEQPDEFVRVATKLLAERDAKNPGRR